MGKILAYLRASTDKQDTNNQKLEVLEFARKKDLKIDDFIELTMSSQKPSKQRRIDELINRLNPSDTLIVTELSRLGRSTAAVISLINTLVENNVRVVILKQNLDIHQHDMNSKIIITMFSLFGELERDLVSLRTKEALAAKKSQGRTLGKPKGTIQRSKFDQHVEQIKALLEIGLSVRKIAKVLGYNHHIALNTYINKRQIRSLKVAAKPLKTL
ncbi:MAG: recombinase family protein [Methylococcaceae bacterium]|nr:recombinase family protein [Methylococcaceae bacterium]MDD1610663.1 recombinase family protein [Methylococcaceae bacterium]